LLSDQPMSPKGKKIIQEKFETALKSGVLNLSQQRLKPTSAAWGQFIQPIYIEKLIVLDISGNVLKGLPAEVSNLLNLKTLIANRCSIQRIHDHDMHHFQKLTILRLQNNDLENDTLHRLPPSLQHLTLSSNHFHQLPTTLYSLVHLISLDMRHNRLESIYGIEQLVNLRELILDNNSLTELPDSLILLTKLHTLSLTHNQIQKISSQTEVQSIPKAIFAMQSLEVMILTGNPLQREEIMTFEGIEEFLIKRKLLKDKLIHGGGMTDFSLFGLD